MTLNLINAFSYYLVLVFVIGTVLRARNIRAMLGMVYRSGDRWPKLRALVSSHWAIFVRWPTVLPLVLTLLLTLTNTLSGYFVWPQARVTPGDLWSHPTGLAAVIVVGSLMGFLDFRTVFLFGRFDRPAVEAMLDRAEHWLGSWKAPAVRIMTFGLIHPRRIVGEQVRQALVDASMAANGQLWATSLQIVVRFAFGLTLWITWAVR
jgi:hypothetical protein